MREIKISSLCSQKSILKVKQMIDNIIRERKKNIEKTLKCEKEQR